MQGIRHYLLGGDKRKGFGMSKFSDCGSDGCGVCEVCIYLAFIEWASSVDCEGATIERNPEMEKYLKDKYGI